MLVMLLALHDVSENEGNDEASNEDIFGALVELNQSFIVKEKESSDGFER